MASIGSIIALAIAIWDMYRRLILAPELGYDLISLVVGQWLVGADHVRLVDRLLFLQREHMALDHVLDVREVDKVVAVSGYQLGHRPPLRTYIMK